MKKYSKSKCNKCETPSGLNRHHMGCEAMWLRHFAHKSRTKLYIAYKLRYESFNPADVVHLCIDCHNIIHAIYLPIINQMVADAGYRKLSEWSWEEARGMMQRLRKTCEMWLEGKL